MTKPAGGNDDLIIFCDFDGTISLRDVGNRLFHHFSDGRSDEQVGRWRADEIDYRQCLEQEAALMRPIAESELFEFIDGFAIDPSFPSFAAFCRRENLPLYILSDGLDIYITRLLERNGLRDLPVRANHGQLVGGRLQISWPHHDPACTACGNCKGIQMRRLRRPGGTAVFIGDGKSDLCALPEADLLLAKGFLADYCRHHGLSFVPFASFADVATTVKDRLSPRPANHKRSMS